jgi:hypothetical protein
MKFDLTPEELARLAPDQVAFLEALEWQTMNRPKPQDDTFRGLPLTVVERHNAEDNKARYEQIRRGDGISLPELFDLPETNP